MSYNHGMRVQEQATSLATPVESTAGLQVVVGTAPINLLADPASAVNKLIIAYSFAEAVEALGYSSDYANYTLCESMDANFKMRNNAPIIFVNVLDPEKHKKTVSAVECKITDGQAVMTEKGMLLDSLNVTVTGSSSAKLTATTHYLAEFDSDGNVVISLTAAGKQSVGSNTKLSVSGNKIDPTAVKAEDIIGGVDASTGKETGIELLRQVDPKFGMTPGILIAPGYSKLPAIGAVMQAKCVELNSRYKLMCILDISATSAKKYTDVAEIKTSNGFTSEYAISVWPKVKYAGNIMHYSTVLAAEMCYMDSENSDIPALSPSNKTMPVQGACLDDGSDVLLDENQANALNSQGIVTAIPINGSWRVWGNNTSCYPSNTDPKDRWISVRRMFNWQGNTFIKTYFDKVDDNTNYKLIESLVDAENLRGNSLVAQGFVAGMKLEFNEAENPIANILDGKIKFHQKFSPYTPAEYIENVLEFDPTLVQNALTGG